MSRGERARRGRGKGLGALRSHLDYLKGTSIHLGRQLTPSGRNQPPSRALSKFLTHKIVSKIKLLSQSTVLELFANTAKNNQDKIQGLVVFPAQSPLGAPPPLLSALHGL